jgi:hypothetical protein
VMADVVRKSLVMWLWTRSRRDGTLVFRGLQSDIANQTLHIQFIDS